MCLCVLQNATYDFLRKANVITTLLGIDNNR